MKTEELHPRIKIRSPLRCDGIGRLDCAEDTESGARLAVRWLPLDANGDAAVRACAKLPEHPTLPRVRQTGQVGDKAFLAMEFPDGQLLSTLLGDPLNGDLLLEMGAQLADALATIHSQNVFHGELSAESVLLAKGKAYLWDMPLVIANRLTDRRGEERLMHQLVRTAPFLSPERARGAGATAEGDVYALAAVMCLAGGAKAPPLGTTLSVVHAIVSGEWQPAVPAVFHEPFRSLLNRMLARESSLRPSAREVADLLGKPAAALPTIPEMPAIVLPKSSISALLGPRPLPKTPYAAAPGSLQPMLPTKAVSDAAKKIASAPLEITVPTEAERTVEVKLPVQVLVAMSQPVAVDSELKAAIDALKPASRPAARTLEFGTAMPRPPVLTALPASLPPPPVKEKTPPPAMAAMVNEVKAALAAREKTPPPALSPVLAEVKAALAAKEKTPPPAIAPVIADVSAALKRDVDAPITAPNPPPIPHKPSREMPVPPMLADSPPPGAMQLPAIVEGPKLPPVELQENICVSAETFAAGAVALEPDEAEALDVLPRSKPTFLIAAAVLAVLTTALAVGAKAVTSRHVEPTAKTKVSHPVTQTAKAQPKAAPVAPPAAGETDELFALPVSAPSVSKPQGAPSRRGVRRSNSSASRLEGKYDSHNEPPPADDFSFLGTGYEAPKEELKRPSF